MYTIKRTNSTNTHFRQLVVELDKDLAIRDGDEHEFFAQYNQITHIQHVVVAFDESGKAVGCGAIKTYSDHMMEIKRMYVLPEKRSLGIASLVLAELEVWAKELGATGCILETGIKQPEAIRLYEKNGYHLIPNYGQYVGVESSRCFTKELRS